MDQVATPFLLDNDAGYQQWRDTKLKHYPDSIDDLIVEVKDPKNISLIEYQKLLEVCRKCNMAIYSGQDTPVDDPAIPLKIGEKFGLIQLDQNLLSEKNGLSKLTVDKIKGSQRGYIPYSNKALQWHTDGYYNKPDHQIHAVILHCVQSALDGGANQLLDHEIAYIALRDQNPGFIKTLMAEDALTIPARMEDGKIARAAETGPVFSVDSTSGRLHMRFTIRKRNIEWKNNAETSEALAALIDFLESDSAYILNGRLEAGMGLICSNVLHTRTAFKDDESHRRILYRARYFDQMTSI